MYRRNKIQQWIADGEGPFLDFKQSITSPAKIARSLVAFANSRGGKIVVGVADQGHIVGVDTEGEKYELDKAASQFCDPPIALEYEEYEMYHKMLLIVYVEESFQKPHYSIDKKGRRRLYIRVADECIVANSLINKTLVSGDMNKLERNAAYAQLKRDLITFLQKNKTISITNYMRWKNCSERSATRTLLDFLFEGLLHSKDGQNYRLGKISWDRAI